MKASETKTCRECHVLVQTPHREFCPLCGAALEKSEDCGIELPQNPYPDLSRTAAQGNFVMRLLLFLSLLGAATSLLINFLVPAPVWWSLIVIAAIIYLWLSVPPLLARGVNYTKRIMFQVIFTCILVVILDALIGWQGWSVTYVIPGLLCGGIVGIGVMVVFNRTNWQQYILYQLLMAVFGLTPLLLWVLGLEQNIVMVIITVSLALASLLATIVFGDRTVKSEFKRRFHF